MIDIGKGKRQSVKIHMLPSSFQGVWGKHTNKNNKNIPFVSTSRIDPSDSSKEWTKMVKRKFQQIQDGVKEYGSLFAKREALFEAIKNRTVSLDDFFTQFKAFLKDQDIGDLKPIKDFLGCLNATLEAAMEPVKSVSTKKTEDLVVSTGSGKILEQSRAAERHFFKLSVLHEVHKLIKDIGEEVKKPAKEKKIEYSKLEWSWKRYQLLKKLEKSLDERYGFELSNSLIIQTLIWGERCGIFVVPTVTNILSVVKASIRVKQAVAPILAAVSSVLEFFDLFVGVAKILAKGGIKELWLSKAKKNSNDIREKQTDNRINVWQEDYNARKKKVKEKGKKKKRITKEPSKIKEININLSLIYDNEVVKKMVAYLSKTYKVEPKNIDKCLIKDEEGNFQFDLKTAFSSFQGREDKTKIMKEARTKLSEYEKNALKKQKRFLKKEHKLFDEEVRSTNFVVNGRMKCNRIADYCIYVKKGLTGALKRLGQCAKGSERLTELQRQVLEEMKDKSLRMERKLDWANIIISSFKMVLAAEVVLFAAGGIFAFFVLGSIPPFMLVFGTLLIVSGSLITIGRIIYLGWRRRSWAKAAWNKWRIKRKDQGKGLEIEGFKNWGKELNKLGKKIKLSAQKGGISVLEVELGKLLWLEKYETGKGEKKIDRAVVLKQLGITEKMYQKRLRNLEKIKKQKRKGKEFKKEDVAQAFKRHKAKKPLTENDKIRSTAFVSMIEDKIHECRQVIKKENDKANQLEKEIWERQKDLNKSEQTIIEASFKDVQQFWKGDVEKEKAKAFLKNTENFLKGCAHDMIDENFGGKIWEWVESHGGKDFKGYLNEEKKMWVKHQTERFVTEDAKQEALTQHLEERALIYLKEMYTDLGLVVKRDLLAKIRQVLDKKSKRVSRLGRRYSMKDQIS